MLIFIHKKCELSFILGRSGIHSHVLQYQQKVHTRSVNIRYISEVHYNLWMIERLLNKANAIILMSFCFPSVSDARIPRSARKHLRGAGFAFSPAKVLLFFHICKFFCIFEPFCYDSTKKVLLTQHFFVVTNPKDGLLFRFVADGFESFGLVHSEIGEDLAVDFDAGFFQSAH